LVKVKKYLTPIEHSSIDGMATRWNNLILKSFVGREGIMQSNHSKRGSALWALGFAALWPALTVAAGGSALAAPAETVLYSFTGGSDGAIPQAGLIADSSGNLYGTTNASGAFFSGVVFKLAPNRIETVLHAFTGGGDGANPQAGLISDGSGNLYGTTAKGGPSGNGVVFKLSPGGTYTVLHSFTGSDGGTPEASLIADSSGNLYGTTEAGGPPAQSCGGLGCGVVFKLSPGGTYTVLHSFAGGSIDGANPAAGLIADSKGNLYGTTAKGGPSGNGVVFKLGPDGTETVLHAFTGSDGANPEALLADSKGNLYGTTISGGGSGAGVVFKLSPGGTYTVLQAFCSISSSGCNEGTNPTAGLTADSSGNLYGTTSSGGPSFEGTVFKLSDGTYTVLYSFTGGSDGANPQAGLIADSKGNLYGTTNGGGASGNGTVFELAGRIPFAAFSPTLMINFGTTPDTDAFSLKSSFTLGSASSGINPLGEAVTFQIGTLITTIPAGSFRGTVTSSAFGPFTFIGNINGVFLNAAIAPTGTKRFSFEAGAQGASLAETVNPVPVTLTIGNYSGTASVTATIK
jgi:uncharacterized repeat protein (TIGR03803 family)